MAVTRRDAFAGKTKSQAPLINRISQRALALQFVWGAERNTAKIKTVHLE